MRYHVMVYRDSSACLLITGSKSRNKINRTGNEPLSFDQDLLWKVNDNHGDRGDKIE